MALNEREDTHTYYTRGERVKIPIPESPLAYRLYTMRACSSSILLLIVLVICTCTCKVTLQRRFSYGSKWSINYRERSFKIGFAKITIKEDDSLVIGNNSEEICLHHAKLQTSQAGNFKRRATRKYKYNSYLIPSNRDPEFSFFVQSGDRLMIVKGDCMEIGMAQFQTIVKEKLNGEINDEPSENKDDYPASIFIEVAPIRQRKARRPGVTTIIVKTDSVKV